MTPVEKRIDEFASAMGDIVSLDMKKCLIDRGFFTAPASTKFHGAYEGGLFDHSLSVMECLVSITESCNVKWGNPRSPYIVGMFHDLCKIDQYRLVRNADGAQWEYNDNTLLKGHGDKSVMLLSQFFQLTEEEIMCVRYHMGAFTNKDEWNYYTRAVKKYPTVLWTHTADMLASHVKGV